jgi:hypothetical protein
MFGETGSMYLLIFGPFALPSSTFSLLANVSFLAVPVNN